MRVAEREFTVRYDGPALATGQMPVSELAPALLALGEIFTEASRTLYPGLPPVALNIRATEKGSFSLRLILEAKRAWDDLINLGKTEEANALANLEAIIIGVGGVTFGGLFWLIKCLRGRRIKAIQEANQPGIVRLVIDDETSIETSADAAALFQRTTIRKKTQKVIGPLRRSGVETLAFVEEKEVSLIIGEDDVDSFDYTVIEEDVLDYEQVVGLQIVTLEFKKTRWRFTIDGQSTFPAEIDDEQFLARVSKDVEAFHAGDVLRCRLRVIQTRTPDGLNAEYRVLQVLDHIPPPSICQVHNPDGF